MLLVAILLAMMMAGTAYGQEAPPAPDETAPAEPPAYDETLGSGDADAVEVTITDTGVTTTDADGRTVDAKASTSLRSCGNYSVELTSFEATLMEKINRKRADLGRQRMCVEVRMMDSSLYWSKYMARNNDFYHGGLRYVCSKFNYCGWNTLYENLAYGDKDTYGPGDVFNGYLNSSSHRAAMLGANRDRMGTDFESNSDWMFNTLHMSDHPNE